MQIGPKYKIARRLGAPVFEKTQTQKFAQNSERKGKSRRPRSDYGTQMNEKQKARMFYAVSEKQFSKYVAQALAKKEGNPAINLFALLETRLDNAVWRAGLCPTHLAARQAAAHGHFIVNGKRSYVPSLALKAGDTVTIREGSKNSKLWNELDTRMATVQSPDWLSWDAKKQELTIKGKPAQQNAEALFDLGQVLEFYQR